MHRIANPGKAAIKPTLSSVTIDTDLDYNWYALAVSPYNTTSCPTCGRDICFITLNEDHNCTDSMLNTYRYINVPNADLISNKMCDYVCNHTTLLDGNLFWNWGNVSEIFAFIPELKDYVKTVGLEVRHIGIIIVKEGFPDIPHIDGIPDCRILWPVLNCDGAETRFYNINNKDTKEVVIDDTLKFYHVQNLEAYDPIDVLHLSQPAIINPGIAHCVIINNKEKLPRISFSVGFNHIDDRATSIYKW